jgi:carbonic anhydrase
MDGTVDTSQDRLPSLVDGMHAYEQVGASRSQVAAQEHVLLQLKHLLRYPGFQVKYAIGEVCIHGWLHDEASGRVHAYHCPSGQFLPFCPSVLIQQ